MHSMLQLSRFELSKIGVSDADLLESADPAVSDNTTKQVCWMTMSSMSPSKQRSRGAFAFTPVSPEESSEAYFAFTPAFPEASSEA